MNKSACVYEVTSAFDVVNKILLKS